MLFYLGQVLEQSLLMAPLVLGIYVSFGVLKIADLSVDGSFVFGAAVFAALTSRGAPLVIAMVCAVLAGAGAGVIVSMIQKKNRIDPLIAGILMAFVLHSLSLVVMQRPNIGLLKSVSIFSVSADFFQLSPSSSRLLVLVTLLGIIAVALGIYLSSSRGLWLKAFGNNQDLVALLGQNPEMLRLRGLALGNGLAALSGCLTAQASGYADINMGFGQALIGIAMILLGKELLRFFSKRDVFHDGVVIVSVFSGATLYFFLTNELIRLGLNPVYLKMAIGVFLIAFLLISSQRSAQASGRSS